MSKICNRIYSGNSMLAVEQIDGVECCTLCKNPAVCHGKTIEQRALYWALAGSTGTSSNTLARHMIGVRVNGLFSAPPSDADDRRRCIRLLELVPEWIPRLPELAKHEKPSSDGVVISSSGISANENSWAVQIPLIIKEGNL